LCENVIIPYLSQNSAYVEPASPMVFLNINLSGQWNLTSPTRRLGGKMAEPFLGQIIMFAGNFAIRGYAMCNGQILSIAQNTALFSILGTTYGGNGQTTFALPDLRGRVPIHVGQGPGLSSYSLGQVSGVENTTLTINNMPIHNHLMRTSSSDGNDSTPAPTTVPGVVKAGNTAANAYTTAAFDTNFRTDAISQSGGSQPFSTLQPYLVINFLIALEGIFPARN
jgi:microcystin-dependent protein